MHTTRANGAARDGGAVLPRESGGETVGAWLDDTDHWGQGEAKEQKDWTPQSGGILL